MLKIVYILSVVIVIFGGVLINLNKNNRLVFLDIGQGDSILIETMDRKLALVDTGGDNSLVYSLDKVLPVWERYIDIVIITHSDLDHLGSLDEIIERYEIGTIFWNNTKKENEEISKIENLISEHNIERRELFKGDKLSLGCCVVFNTIWPRKESSEYLSENDLSISFDLRIDEKKIYLAGDLSKEYEDLLVSELPENIDIFKLSHHGSKTSTSSYLIENTNPKYIVVSAGENNKFNHPHPEVIKLFENEKFKLFSTIQGGNIELKIKDGKIYLNCELKC